MGMRRWLKSLAGRKGGATHSGTPGSHVNTKRNKRITNKAARKAARDMIIIDDFPGAGIPEELWFESYEPLVKGKGKVFAVPAHPVNVVHASKFPTNEDLIELHFNPEREDI